MAKLTEYSDLPIEARNALELELDKFDASKAHTLFEFLNWNWSSAAEGIPSAPEIREMARSVMYCAYKQTSSDQAHGYSKCGGIRGDCWRWGDEIEFFVAFEAVSS